MHLKNVDFADYYSLHSESFHGDTACQKSVEINHSSQNHKDLDLDNEKREIDQFKSQGILCNVIG